MDQRSITAAPPPQRFARGWHCLGLARTYRDGEPHAVEAFGTKLVVFQGSDGTINALEAFCRHMGGDLSQGTVKGDTIACPFHDWRWAGDGRCAAIPYSKRVPRAARTRTWPTMERNGQLFVWNDPRRDPPPPGVTIPHIEGASSDEWSDWTWNTLRVEGSHCREIVDNVADMAHFFYVHYAMPTYFKNVFEGHVAAQYYRGRSREDAYLGLIPGVTEPAVQRSEAAYHGPSYMIDELWTTVAGITVEVVLINCHYPITGDAFMLQWGAIVKRLPGMSDDDTAAMAAQVSENVGLGFLQDVEIWKNKAPIDNPLLCDHDGPVYQLRRWYEQFYVDVEDVTPEMTARFEFEIDTTHAVDTWQREVAQNMADGISFSALPASLRQ